MSDDPKNNDQRLLYSNFIAPRKDGYFGLTTSATYGVLAASAVAMVLYLVPLPFTFKLLCFVALVILVIPLIIGRGGRSGWEIILGGRGRRRQRKNNEHTGRSGPGTRVPDGTPLPAQMANSELTEHSTGQYKFGLIRVRPEDYYTVVFRVWPQGREWNDQGRKNTWVENYGHMLAQIGQAGDVVGIVTVIESLPESGQRVAREFSSQVRNENAHELSKRVMYESVFTIPSTEVRPEGRISVTFRANTGLRRRDTQEQAADISRRMGRMLDLIEQAGLPCRPMSKRELIAITRRAMSPSDEMALEKALLSGEPLGIDWRDVGAIASSDQHAYFAHDSARSVTWVMASPSKAPVDSQVLDDLLAPRADLPRKRVAFIYRPHTPAEATDIVDGDLQSAERAIRNPRGRLSEHARVRFRAADASRREQALGAGVTRFTIMTTVTVPADGDLSKAEALMNDAHTSSRVKMRVATDQQAVAFLASLGIGLVLPAHATISDRLAA